MKYKDVTWGAPISGEMLAANGIYTGQQKGTPTQGKDETAYNGDAYFTEHNTVHFGTITQDAQDANFPKVLYEVFYNLNGAVGTTPAAQVQSDFGAAVTLSAAPTITTYPAGMTAFKEWNAKPDGTGTTYAASGALTPTADTTLYAIYQAAAKSAKVGEAKAGEAEI